MEILLGKSRLRMSALSFTARALISLSAMSGTSCAVWLTILTSRSCDFCIVYVTFLGYQYENDYSGAGKMFLLFYCIPMYFLFKDLPFLRS